MPRFRGEKIGIRATNAAIRGVSEYSHEISRGNANIRGTADKSILRSEGNRVLYAAEALAQILSDI